MSTFIDGIVYIGTDIRDLELVCQHLGEHIFTKGAMSAYLDDRQKFTHGKLHFSQEPSLVVPQYGLDFRGVCWIVRDARKPNCDQKALQSVKCELTKAHTFNKKVVVMGLKAYRRMSLIK